MSMAVSRALASDLGPGTIVAPTPYRDSIFYPRPEIVRDRDLVFVGRLVSDKGVDILIDALGRLGTRGVRPNLTIIGNGPELPRLEAAVNAEGLATQVTFDGMLEGRALALELARHEVLVVPSRYREPFGIVALEGLASGCVVIGSEGGGLPDAIGRGGLTFPNGSASGLAEQIDHVLASAKLRRELRAAAVEHLQAFRGDTVARAYLEIFRRLTSDRS
jgi:glycosyltransferase involved in cell wall biosynthesis